MGNREETCAGFHAEHGDRPVWQCLANSQHGEIYLVSSYGARRQIKGQVVAFLAGHASRRFLEIGQQFKD